MSLEECYAAIGGDYEGVRRRMLNDARIGKFVGLFLQDDTFPLLVSSLEQQNPPRRSAPPTP